MFRRDYIGLLREPRSVHQLARELELAPGEVEDDLAHLLKSLRHSETYRAVVTPAHCRHCGFTFQRERLGKPGKCPRCRHTWIEAPMIRIEERSTGVRPKRHKQ
jgi:predicted Zn-ribbon and HTH transcriptional regulator